MLKRRLSRVFVATKCLDISVVERNPMDCLDPEFRAVGHELRTRRMPKIAGLALVGVHGSALHSPIQSARKVLRLRRAGRAFVRWKGTLLCRKRSALRRGSVQVKLYPCWESPGHLWQRRPADH